MKYRIKIIDYKDGIKAYVPQKKLGLFWVGIDFDGSLDIMINTEYNSRESALLLIDKNHAGDNKIKQINFEYISK